MDDQVCVGSKGRSGARPNRDWGGCLRDASCSLAGLDGWVPVSSAGFISAGGGSTFQYRRGCSHVSFVWPTCTARAFASSDRACFPCHVKLRFPGDDDVRHWRLVGTGARGSSFFGMGSLKSGVMGPSAHGRRFQVWPSSDERSCCDSRGNSNGTTFRQIGAARLFATIRGDAKGRPVNGGVPQEPAGSSDDGTGDEGDANAEAIKGPTSDSVQKRSRQASSRRKSKLRNSTSGELGKSSDIGVASILENFGMLPDEARRERRWVHRSRKANSGWIFTVLSEALPGLKSSRLKREQRQQLVALENNLKRLVRELAKSPPVLQPAEDIRQALALLNRLRGLVFYSAILGDKYVASFVRALKGLVSSALLLGMDLEPLEFPIIGESAGHPPDTNARRISRQAERAPADHSVRRRSERLEDPKRKELILRMNDKLVEEILGSSESGSHEWVAPLESPWASAPWKAPFVQFYRDVSELYTKDGLTWEGHILDLALYSVNAYTESVQQSPLSGDALESGDDPRSDVLEASEATSADGTEAFPVAAVSDPLRNDVFRRSVVAMVCQDLDVLQDLCSWSPYRLARCIAFSIMKLTEADLERFDRQQSEQTQKTSGAPVREPTVHDAAEMLVTLLAKEPLPPIAVLENGLVAQSRVPRALVADALEQSLRSVLFKSALTASVSEPKLRRRWSQYLPLITKRIQLRGDGVLGQYYMLYFSNREQRFRPAESPDVVRLDDIVGYDEIKQAFVQNIKYFLAGHHAHHVLLLGAFGVGKSALVKAVANEFYGTGLRLVQLDSGYFGAAQGLGTVPTIRVKGGKSSKPITEEDIPLGALGFAHDVQGLAKQAWMHPNLRFVLFLDDVVLDDEDPRLVALRGVLSGGMLSLPQNMIVVATCSTGILAPDFFAVNVASDDDIMGHPKRARSKRRLRMLPSVDFFEVFSGLSDDTVTFLDRFGMVLTFDSPNKSMYLDFVRHALERYGDAARRIPWNTLRKRALAYARARSSYSARTARHFISAVEDEQRFVRAGAPSVPSADALASMTISDPDNDDDDDDEDEDEDEDDDDEFLDDEDFGDDD